MTFINTTDEKDTIPNLRLMIGGKQPPKKGQNWLNDLKQWTIFCAKNPKLSNVDLFLFQVREKYANTTVLIVFLPKEEPHVRYFSTVDFSNEYVLMDIIDDPGNRTDLDRRLETDADTEHSSEVAEVRRQEEILRDNREGKDNIRPVKD